MDMYDNDNFSSNRQKVLSDIERICKTKNFSGISSEKDIESYLKRNLPESFNETKSAIDDPANFERTYYGITDNELPEPDQFKKHNVKFEKIGISNAAKFLYRFKSTKNVIATTENNYKSFTEGNALVSTSGDNTPAIPITNSSGETTSAITTPDPTKPEDQNNHQKKQFNPYKYLLKLLPRPVALTIDALATTSIIIASLMLAKLILPAVIIKWVILIFLVFFSIIGLWIWYNESIDPPDRKLHNALPTPEKASLYGDKIKQFFGFSNSELPEDLQAIDISSPSVSINENMLNESLVSGIMDFIQNTFSVIAFKALFILNKIEQTLDNASVVSSFSTKGKCVSFLVGLLFAAVCFIIILPKKKLNSNVASASFD